MHAKESDSWDNSLVEEEAVMRHMDRIARELHDLARQRSSLPVGQVR